MEGLVLRSLAKIRKLVGGSSRKHKALRDACDTVMEHLKSKGWKEDGTGGPGAAQGNGGGGGVEDTDADKFFEPFKLACESRVPKVMEAALDAIQKLVAYGYLRGTSTVTYASPPARTPGMAAPAPGVEDGGPGAAAEGTGEAGAAPAVLMDVVVQTVCDCCSEQQEEAVQLQVMKALLECVISSHTEVHQASLLQAVRACYNINLVSRNAVNRTTAKATLTQMLSIVFQRMEAFDRRAKEEAQAALLVLGQHAQQAAVATALSPGKGGGARGGAGVGSPTKQQPQQPSPPSPARGHEAGSPSRPAAAGAAAGGGGPNLYPAVFAKLGFRASPSASASAGGAAARRHMVAAGGRSGSSASSTAGAAGPGAPEFPSVLHKDAYLLFRALCRLSVKGQYDGDPSLPADPVALQSKILSLELLLSILETAGPCFRGSDKFVYLVRNHLCSSLLKNATSSNTAIVGLSLRIFVAMTAHFKDSLKAELEVFVSNIFLKLLESENSSFEHKMLVLQVFHNLCQDPQLLIEIFLNYDCDLGATSVFSRIVLALSKVANGRGQAALGSESMLGGMQAARRLQEEMALRTGGLEGLVAITHSLVKAGGFDEQGLQAQEGEKEGQEQQQQPQQQHEGAATTQGPEDWQGQAEEALGESQQAQQEEEQQQQQQQQNQAQQAAALSAVVESYDRKQKLQEEISLGVTKFNLKPSQGIAYMEAHGHLAKTPQDVARFLHEYQGRLDKTVIGDYLGKEKEYDGGFCVKVLHEYVDMMDLQNLAFDAAIRHFLAGFRLPGEAQKIDRIMEKFAERFCLQNPAIFPSADTAFILSFSTIMLNTDLHNPSVREDRKMTKEDFIRNNRGISSQGGDLPEAFLSQIYDNIKRSPISLKEDDDLRARMGGTSGAGAGGGENPFISTLSLDKRRKEAYLKEREAMVQASEAIFRQRKRREAAAAAAAAVAAAAAGGEAGGAAVGFRSPLEDPSVYVRPMFEVAWGPMLGVFSQMIKSAEDARMLALSLEGFQNSIRIAARCNLPTARDLLVNTLYKFTSLGEVAAEIKPRQIDCIQALVGVALSEGDYLNEAWLDVLQCISHLARLQQFASGLHTDDVYFPPAHDGAPVSLGSSGLGGSSSSSSSSRRPHRGSGAGGGGNAGAAGGAAAHGGFGVENALRLFSGPSKAEAARAVEESNAEAIMGAVDAATVERIFTSSVALDSQAIQHFVIQLCEVSKQEVGLGPGASGPGGQGGSGYRLAKAEEQPRVFSLQKLVEVADFNMHARSRLVWANVWEVLSRHYAAVGLHGNTAVAMYAIDSLRQLSMKFLNKEELRDFNFQRLFLRPFEAIMAGARSIELRELILRCLDNLVSARAHNIRSGWKSIFAVFTLAASSADEGLCQFAFDMTDGLFREHFPLLVFDFVDLVHCLLAFAENRHHLHIALAAIAHLQRAASLLAEGAVTEPRAGGGGLGQRGASPRTPGQGPDKEEGLSASASSPRSSGSGVATSSPGFAVQQGHGGSGAGGGLSETALQLWWPLLVGLSARVADPRLPLRTSALEALMNTLRQHGGQFSPQTWKLVFRGVLFPLLESARTDCTPQAISEAPALNPPLEARDDSWILTTTEAVLKAYVELLELFWPTAHALAPEVLAVLSDCVCQHERETLARIACTVLHRDVILGLAARVPPRPPSPSPGAPALWDAVAACLLGLVRKNLPEWGSLELLAAAVEAGARGAISSRGLTPNNRATYAGTTGSSPGRGSSAGMMLQHDDAFSTPVDGIDDEEEEEDLEGDLDGAESAAGAGAGGAGTRPGRDFSFSFAMVNNGTIMTQMVVGLLAQRMALDCLERYWAFLGEENLLRLLTALMESADYAAEFNMNLSLRERLRQGGLMQQQQQQQNGAGLGLSQSHAQATRLPHMHEQAIEGYGILLRALFRLYPAQVGAEAAGEEGGLGWDRRPVVEPVLVRYAALVLRQYTELEEDLARSRHEQGQGQGKKGERGVSVAAAHAMNTEVAAYTPLVLFVLRSLRALPLAECGRHLDWLFPAVSDLLLVRSLEVRKEVRTLLQTRVGPFALGQAVLPPSPRAAAVAAAAAEAEQSSSSSSSQQPSAPVAAAGEDESLS